MSQSKLRLYLRPLACRTRLDHNDEFAARVQKLPKSTVPTNAEAIIELRKSRGLTQQTFCKKVGCSKRTVENAEAGKPISTSWLEKMAAVLGVVVDQIAQSNSHTQLGSSFFDWKKLSGETELMSAVAREVALKIPDGDSLCCSSGLTVAISVGEIFRLGKQVQIASNNLGLIDYAGDSRSICLSGGEYVRSIHACTGRQAVSFFAGISCRTALLGVSAISESGECFVLHPEDLPVYEQMIDSTTKERFILAAHITKLTRAYTYPFARIQDLLQNGQRKRDVLLVTNPASFALDKGLQKKAAETLEALKALSQENSKFQIIETTSGIHQSASVAGVDAAVESPN